MSVAPQQQPPTVPPRPEHPKVPPRPARRAIQRSVSPSKDRFAPSPLNETQFLSKSPHGTPSGSSSLKPGDEFVDHQGSVELPALGQEGLEYAAVEELGTSHKSQASSTGVPEHTRTVGEDVKLHAPKPSLPSASAKQRVAAVTHTSSEKAASLGLGRAGGDDAQDATKRKASTTSQVSSDELADEDEHGIPEIGRQVPMYPNAGDVQAPTPAQLASGDESVGKRSHSTKPGARGFGDLPPGSYGLHGHGVIPSDKLEKQYYDKHPELAKLEHTSHHSDRTKDYSRTSDELNNIVRETASHGTGIGAHDIAGTPSEQVGWQAMESSSRPASVAPKAASSSFGSQSSATASVPKPSASDAPEISVSEAIDESPATIHIDEPNRRKSVMFTEGDSAEPEDEEEAPILAPDEVAKNPPVYDAEPAVEPTSYERRHSSYSESSSHSASRPTSRPTSIYKSPRAADEPVVEEEYEPLFPAGDDKNVTQAPPAKSFQGDETTPRFPSRDIWEDAPNSAHYTAEVSAPESPVEQASEFKPTAREGETPAQAFARRQEELAEKELQGADALIENRKPQKQGAWAQEQPHLAKEAMAAAAAAAVATSAAGTGASSPAAAAAAAGASSSNNLRRPAMAPRFPSRDVWEDAPESLQLETTVSTPQEEDSPVDGPKPMVPRRPIRKLTDPEKALPLVPSRPKPKVALASADVAEVAEAKHVKPHVPERPKPHIPARPVKQHMPMASAEKEPEAAAAEAAPKAKPAVPARPVGGKISQLQASFMSDLNKKLKIGPQAPKKEDEPEPEAEAAPVAEKAPLVDARKGRARGPQRRAPARASPSPAAAATPAPAVSTVSAVSAPLTLSFSTTTTLFAINPEDDVLSVHVSDKEVEPVAKAVEPIVAEPTEKEVKKEVEEVKKEVEEVKEEVKEEEVDKVEVEEPSEDKVETKEPELAAVETETAVKADAEAAVAEDEPDKVEEAVPAVKAVQADETEEVKPVDVKTAVETD